MTVETRTKEQAGTSGWRRYEPDDRWVPVDRRWLGLDRATLLPATVVIVFAVVMAVVLPALDRAAPYDDVVAAGDVLELDGEITFTPATGWGITAGVRASERPASGLYPDTATVVDGDVTVTVRTGVFTGDAEALLTRITTTAAALHGTRGLHVTGEPETIVTATGARGVIAGYSGTHTDGVIAAFVFGDRGVQVVATGPADMPADTTDAVAHMITSIDHRAGGAA